jgi:hypothetical protein
VLQGKELISFVNENEDTMNQTELARSAGYTRVKEDGKTLTLVKKFNDALLRAMGVNILTSRSPGKTAQFETTVHRSGIVLVGKTYVEKFGLKAGDSLDIVLDDEFIKLVPKAASQAAAVVETAQKVAVAA